MNEPYGGYSHERRGQMDGYGVPFDQGPVDQWGRYNPHGANSWMPEPAKQSSLGPAALVLGVVSMPMALFFPIAGVIAAIVGIVCGAMAVSESRRGPMPGRKGMPIAGAIMSVIGLLVNIAVVVLLGMAIYYINDMEDSGVGGAPAGPEGSSESILERLERSRTEGT